MEIDDDALTPELKADPIVVKIWELILRTPESIPAQLIKTETKAEDKDLGRALSQLIKEGFIDTVVTGTGRMIKKGDRKQFMRTRYLSDDEKLVYLLIQRTKSVGIAKTEIQSELKMAPQTAQKCLTKLEKQGYIKSYKPLRAKNKKMWILDEYEANEDETGGIWYGESGLEADFIESMCQKVVDYLIGQQTATLTDLGRIISSAAMQQGKTNFKEDHAKQIISVMLCDDRIEEMVPVAGPKQYRLSKWNDAVPIDKVGLAQTPCGICPVFKECTPDGVISPVKCIYFLDW